MSAWVTDVPNMNGRSTPLQFRFLVAMQGALGIGANLNKWTDEDSALAIRMIAAYKRIRNTVQLGNLYRLLSPGATICLLLNIWRRTAARRFCSRTGIRRNSMSRPRRSGFRGLDPAAVYHLDLIAGRLQDNQTDLSGAYLMNHGISPNLRGDYDCMAVILERRQ